MRSMLQLVGRDSYLLLGGAASGEHRPLHLSKQLRDATQQQRDSLIIEEVARRLANEHILTGCRIYINCVDRVVTLTGEVPSLYANACACEAAFSVEGVSFVKSALTSPRQDIWQRA